MARGRSGGRSSPARLQAPTERRTGIDWGIRIALAASVAVIGGFAMAQSLAQVTVASGRAAAAYALAPWDGRMSAALADANVLSGNTDARTASLGRAALRLDPTTVKAVTSLATAAIVAGQLKRSERLFAYAERLSRRDLATQLWAIENAVARADTAAALRHYDIALRTTATAPELLFPILSRALDDPGIRGALVKTLSQRPLWATSFIDYSATSGVDPPATAQLFTALQRARVPISAGARSELVNRLVDRSAYETAWSVYIGGRPRSDRQFSRDPDFAADIATPAAFDWVGLAGPGVTTSIQRNGSAGLFDFATGPNVAGVLLQQVQLLSPGSYRLDGRSNGIDQPMASRPYWRLRCLGEDRELGRIVLPNSVEANGKFGGSFIVPSGCPAQALTLVAQPTDARAGLAGQIIRAALRPAGSPQ